MPKPRKPDPRRILGRLSDIEQHTLYEFLRFNSYDKGCVWLREQKQIVVCPKTLCNWWSWYASEQLATRLASNTINLASGLKDAGFKVTKENLDEWTMDFFQRQAAIGVHPELCLRFYESRKRLQIAERELRLREKKFDQLVRMEEESRKALQSGGTEAELVDKWKQILNFED